MGKNKAIRRLYCDPCGRRFSERQGSLLQYTKLPEATVIRIVKCLEHGCSIEATVMRPAGPGHSVFSDPPCVTPRCARCVMPTSLADLDFSADGVCAMRLPDDMLRLWAPAAGQPGRPAKPRPFEPEAEGEAISPA